MLSCRFPPSLFTAALIAAPWPLHLQLYSPHAATHLQLPSSCTLLHAISSCLLQTAYPQLSPAHCPHICTLLLIRSCLLRAATHASAAASCTLLICSCLLHVSTHPHLPAARCSSAATSCTLLTCSCLLHAANLQLPPARCSSAPASCTIRSCSTFSSPPLLLHLQLTTAVAPSALLQLTAAASSALLQLTCSCLLLLQIHQSCNHHCLPAHPLPLLSPAQPQSTSAADITVSQPTRCYCTPHQRSLQSTKVSSAAASCTLPSYLQLPPAHCFIHQSCNHHFLSAHPLPL